MRPGLQTNHHDSGDHLAHYSSCHPFRGFGNTFMATLSGGAAQAVVTARVQVQHAARNRVALNGHARNGSPLDGLQCRASLYGGGAVKAN